MYKRLIQEAIISQEEFRKIFKNPYYNYLEELLGD